MTDRNVKVLHETTTGLTGTGQNYSLVRTYEVFVPVDYAPGVRRKVRVTVRWDSYPFQSRYLAEVWTGDGWAELARIAGDDPLMASPKGGDRWPGTGMASGYIPMEHVQEKRESLEWAAGLLLERARAVLE